APMERHSNSMAYGICSPRQTVSFSPLESPTKNTASLALLLRIRLRRLGFARSLRRLFFVDQRIQRSEHSPFSAGCRKRASPSITALPVVQLTVYLIAQSGSAWNFLDKAE